MGKWSMSDKFVLGVNYWPKSSGAQMWRNFSPSEIETEFAVLKELGIDSVRLFILWEDFQNIREFYGPRWDQKNPFDVISVDRTDNKDPVNQKMLGRFDVVIEIARRYRLSVVPTLLTAWMSGIFFDPPFRKDRNIFTDPAMLRYQVSFVGFFARRYKDEKQILAWDLANEQNCVLPCPGHDSGWLWTHLLADEIKKWDKNHPVTSGMHGLDNTKAGEGGFAIKDLAENLDFLCVHPYPLFFPDECPDRSDNLRTSYLAEFQNRLYEGIGGKPVMAEEFGTHGDSCMSEKTAAEYVRVVLHRLLGAGSLGAFFWCAFDFKCRQHPPYDYEPMEVRLGLFDQSGRPNLVGREIKKFSGFLKKAGRAKPLPVKAGAAVVVPWREENQPILFNAFLLGRMAHLNLEFATLDRGFREYRLLLFPCAGSHSMRVRDWETLKEWIKKGGVAYFSYRGFMLPEQNEIFGVETLTRQKEPAGQGKAIFKSEAGSGMKDFYYQRTGDWRLVVKPKGAVMLASDEKKQPLLLANRFGKGKVFLATEPLELYFSRMAEAFPGNQSYRFYICLTEAAGLGGFPKKPNPCLETFEFKDGSAMTIDFQKKSAYLNSRSDRN